MQKIVFFLYDDADKHLLTTLGNTKKMFTYKLRDWNKPLDGFLDLSGSHLSCRIQENYNIKTGYFNFFALFFLEVQILIFLD